MIGMLWRVIMKKSLCLLYGGKSAEHEVSLQTAKAVIQAVDKSKYAIQPIYITKEGKWIKGGELSGPVDNIQALQFEQSPKELGSNSLAAMTQINNHQEPNIFFPLLHGPNGEDGTVQGMLELMNVPYVGNGVLASSAGMDKVIMKNLFAQAGLEQVNYVSFIQSTWKLDQEASYDQVERELGYPCFVKPANLGSSVGINKCENRNELQAAFVDAFKYDRKIIVEQGVVAREIEIGLLGNDDPACSVAGEIIPKKEFYDYQSKYVDGDTALVIPAELSDDLYEEIKSAALTAYKTLDCAGLARIDFFVTEDRRVLINEVNTMPGFTPFSMFPLLWKHTGVEYPQLIDRLIELALERYEEKQHIIHTF